MIQSSFGVKPFVSNFSKCLHVRKRKKAKRRAKIGGGGGGGGGGGEGGGGGGYHSEARDEQKSETSN